jgi:mannose-6-phosphate isomerase-like protein (cupin superfamily)
MTTHRAEERFVTHGDGWVGRFCFSYGEHYDAGNLRYGGLLACNEFVLEPGAGFGLHRHAGIDVVTVVLEGELSHVGPGEGDRLGPGQFRRLRTEGGVEHDERNDGTVPLRFVQAWLEPGHEPWLQLVGAGVTERVAGPAFVLAATGRVEVDGEVLEQGDSLRSEADVTVTASPGATALCWTC